MPVDPQAQRVLDDVERAGLPPLHELSPEEARRQMLDGVSALAKPVEVDSVENRTISTSDGGEIPLRVYRPAGESLPIVVYFHGGGWVIGSIETHDAYCRALANAAQTVVVSVDYRLAPEHRAPTAAEDCYAATVWVAEHTQSLGGRPDAVTVAGDSAGGNLAAAVALMARDRSGPAIAKQVLIYPITDCVTDTHSYGNFADGFYLTRDAMIWFWDLYCPDEQQRTNPYLSPLRADRLADLPPALVITAGCDPLCDEGIAYAERLRDSGVAVTLSNYETTIHGFIRRFDALDDAHRALREVAGFVHPGVAEA